MTGKRLFYFLSILLLQYPFLGSGHPAVPGDSIIVSKIWDKAPYNSFTDLIRFDHAFYCSFREGTKHASGDNDGRVRILRSADGNNWHSVALLKIDGLDLRDPKLSVTPDHKIMVIMAGAVFEKNMAIQKLFPLVAFSDTRGEHFTDPEKAVIDPSVSPSKDWIWRITWNKGIGYGVDYRPKEVHKNGEERDATVILMKTDDGKQFHKVSQLAVSDYPNESTIRLDNRDNMYILIRKDAGDKMGVLAQSKPPYTNWSYTQLDYRLGGPNFLFLNKHRLAIATRQYGQQTATVILVTDLAGKVVKTIELPSGGDTSYPGMVIYKRKLWVSYYSSHEGKPSIYLAKIPLKDLK